MTKKKIRKELIEDLTKETHKGIERSRLFVEFYESAIANEKDDKKKAELEMKRDQTKDALNFNRKFAEFIEKCE